MASLPAQQPSPDQPARIVPKAIKPPTSPPTAPSAAPAVTDDGEVSAEQQELATLLWNKCTHVLRREVDQATWDGFLRQLAPLTFIDQRLTLAAPNQMTRDRVVRHHLPAISEALATTGIARPLIEVIVKIHPLHHEPQGTLPLDADAPGDAPSDLPDGGFDLVIAAAATAASARTATSAPARHPASASPPSSSTATPARSTARPTGLRERDTFDSFIVGPSNRFTASAAQAIAEEPGKKYNPLFIFSNSGLGKTHLLHAIGNYLAASRPEARVLYESSENFFNDLVNAIRHGEQLAFKHHYRDLDVLLLDDVQFMVGKEAMQEELFHTFNELHGADRQIVITCDRRPSDLLLFDDRIRTRCEWGLLTDIQSPDLETRIAILRTLSDQASVPDEVLNYIGERVTDNVRELEGAYTRLMAYATLTDVKPSLELAETLLGPRSAGTDGPINPHTILEQAAALFDTSVEALKGPSRNRDLVTARHVAIYVIRELTGLSSSSIGTLLARDHTTVLHAHNKISQQMATDEKLSRLVHSLLTSARRGG